ncbi:MAG TPA: YceI family protein [Casimicrobiaceae bacterium]|nr:YceI family protein [Casimicrobiaceae bacterium]
MHVRIVIAASATAILAVVALPAAANEETYVLDPVHSQPVFETRHLGMSTQWGSFQKLTGRIALDRAARTGSVDVTIEAASIRTHDSRLDAIVKGDRFFDVEKFPTITFKSSKVVFDGDRVSGIDGELTMVGATRPVNLAITDLACGPQPFNHKPMCGGDATATIKRSEWGMTANLPFSPADEVKLRIPFEAYRQ